MENIGNYVSYTILALFVGVMVYEIVKLIYGSIQDKKNGKA
jgi:capsule polysaccharide export protein KpsE/RkpR